MRTSRELLLELKRYFLSSLSEPSSVWLVPEAGPQLILSTEAILHGEACGCRVDFGTLEALGVHLRTVHVENPGPEPLALEIANPEPWLEARWSHGESRAQLPPHGGTAELELLFAHDRLEERALSGKVRLIAGEEVRAGWSYPISIRARTCLGGPLGRYSFEGRERPVPFDFGLIELGLAAPKALDFYTVAIESLGTEPLLVALENLPDWMMVEVDGYRRRGPGIGRFFERAAPVLVKLHPLRDLRLLGPHEGRLTLCTNDLRQSFRQLELEFHARIEAQRAYVQAADPSPLLVSGTGPHDIAVQLSNLGKASAHLSLSEASPALTVSALPIIPGAEGAVPGRATLEIHLNPRDLSAGAHRLCCTLQVENGVARELRIPILATIPALPAMPERHEVSRLRQAGLGFLLLALLLGMIVLAFSLFGMPPAKL